MTVCRNTPNYPALAERLVARCVADIGEAAPKDLAARLTAVAGALALRHAGPDLLPNERLHLLHDALARAVGAADCRLYLVDLTEGGVAVTGSDGAILSPERFAISGIVGSVLVDTLPAVVPDAQADPRFDRRLDGIGVDAVRSMVCVPLVRGEHCIGVLQVINLAAPPTKADAALAALVAGWIVIVLSQSGKAVGVCTEAGSRIEMPLAIGERRHMDLDGVLGRLVAVAEDVLQADRGTVFFYDSLTDELYSRSGSGLGCRQIRLSASCGLVGAVFRTGVGVRAADVTQDPRYDRSIDRALGYKVSTLMAVPVRGSDGRTLGVFQVVNRRRGEFNMADERRLAGLAEQVGLAFESWRLFDEMATVKSYNEDILRSLPSGVLTTDPHGSVSFANPAVCRILRRGDEDLRGQPITRLFSGLNTWLLEEIEEVSASRTGKLVEGHELMLDGDEWVAVNLSIEPLMSKDGAWLGLVLVMEDVTREKKFRRTMSRLVSDELVDSLIDTEGAGVAGQAQDVSVLMSDIRSFTTLTEAIGPTETVAMLNEYFSFMEDVVSNRKGMVDKYIGDAMMVLFGAPVSTGADAENAVTASVDMLRVLTMLNARRKGAGKQELRIGVGIATGQVITGNIGSSKRMSFTAIGDAVNLSARLEALTKAYGVDVLICGATQARLTADHKVRRLDVIRVRGQGRPSTVYEVADHRPIGATDAWADIVGHYDLGLTAYTGGDWERALGQFQKVLEVDPGDTPSSRMLTRCRRLLREPPQEWDGVWTHQ